MTKKEMLELIEEMECHWGGLRGHCDQFANKIKGCIPKELKGQEREEFVDMFIELIGRNIKSWFIEEPQS